MNKLCHCRTSAQGVFATILTLDNRVIATGLLRLGENENQHGYFWPIEVDESPQDFDTASYAEVIAEVGRHVPSHQHKLYNWRFQDGLPHAGGGPNDPDHYNFERDSDFSVPKR